MIKKCFFFLFVGSMLFSCKAKKITNSSSVIAMSTKDIIRNYTESSFDKKTINARLKAVYKTKDITQSITIKLRLEKDSVIWMSGTLLGIPLAKIIITPNKVEFYEKLGKTYFKGNFELLSDFLGTKVDFEIIQNLLLGQTILSLEKNKYDATVDGVSYLLEPKKQEELFDILFWLNPTNFKVDKQEVRQPINQKRLSVEYLEYQYIDQVVFPLSIKILAIDKTDRTFIDLNYRMVEFDKKLSFPFAIPSGYQEIKLDE